MLVPKVKKNSKVLRPTEEFEMFKPKPNDPCYMICTSGSTGTPKSVVVPHRGVS